MVSFALRDSPHDTFMTVLPADQERTRNLRLAHAVLPSRQHRGRWYQWRMVQSAPPSTDQAAPLTKLAAGDSRNATASATSCGCPMRSCGAICPKVRLPSAARAARHDDLHAPKVFHRTFPNIKSDARSATALTGILLLPAITVGMTEASTTRRASMPLTRSEVSTTSPMRQVPQA